MNEMYDVKLTITGDTHFETDKVFFEGGITDSDTERIMDWLTDHIGAPESEKEGGVHIEPQDTVETLLRDIYATLVRIEHNLSLLKGS